MPSHRIKREPEDGEVSLSGYSQGVQQAEASAQLGIPPESPKEANVYGLSEGDLAKLADRVADKVEDKVSALLVIVFKQIQQQMQSTLETLERALNCDL